MDKFKPKGAGIGLCKIKFCTE